MTQRNVGQSRHLRKADLKNHLYPLFLTVLIQIFFFFLDEGEVLNCRDSCQNKHCSTYVF